MLKLYFFEVRINNNEDFNIFKLVLNSLKMLYDLISTGWASHSANSSYEEVSFIVQNLMDNEEPLYFAVGLLPCARLWFGWLIISAFLQPMPTTLGRWGTWTVILRNTTKLCWISISTHLRKWRRLMLYSALRCRTSMISSSHLEWLLERSVTNRFLSEQLSSLFHENMIWNT